MVMNKMTLVLSAFLVTVGPSLSWSADDPATQPQESATTPGNQGTSGFNSPSSNIGTNQGNQAVQAPPASWTQLTGMVQAVDQSQKTVQIKDDSGKLLQIPVDRHVKIEK